jgi:hypothetical protein
MYEGRLMGIVDPAAATREEVGLMMAGIRSNEGALPGSSERKP